ncbi:hypothetical protein KXS11_12915 [Plantibacter flavus]|uniref:hypothetical protein n=1 Tax=Plantibacter flavus TaxID=150123 RepID=UPI003F177EC6
MIDWDGSPFGTVRGTAEDIIATLETRARCVEEALDAVDAGIAGFQRSRSDLEWVGPASMQFSWAADELDAQLRTAAAALEESLGQVRWAVSAVSAGRAG